MTSIGDIANTATVASVVGQGASSIVLSGALSARPAAGTVGRIYMATDGYPDSYDTGSAWVPRVNGLQCANPPLVGAFTTVNHHYSSLSQDGDGLLLVNMGSNSGTDYLESYLVAAPAAPYIFTVGFSFQFFYPAQYVMIGIMLANGTTAGSSSQEFFTFCQPGTLGTQTPLYLVVQKYANYAWSANVAGFPLTFPLSWPANIFMRIRDDNTNRYFDISTDGRLWVNLYSAARTDFITPTYVGLCTDQQSSAVATTMIRAQARVFHWALG